jgi:thioredoxin-dependent peroxiredoxin
VQGQALRDSADKFQARNCVILGASFDTPADNLAFAEAQQFPFRLLSDTDRSVGAAYGVVRDPDDRYAAFPKRHSFLIDPDGVLRLTYMVSDVEHHAAEVLADLERLQR